MSKKEHRRAELRERREKLEDRGVELAVEEDALERRRAELKDRDPKTEERLAETRAELKENHAELAKIRHEEDELEPRIEKLTRWINQISRSLSKPKIVDLNMDGPCTAMGPIKGSIGHYTAGPLAKTDAEAVRLWWQVRAQHLAQGWSNIGYHIGIGPQGGIYLLRPRGCVGAHTLNNNTGYIGFSVHGTTGHTWTRAQRRAFRYALKHFGLIDKPVYGHNDFMATGCPGSFKTGYVTKGKNA